MIATPLPAWISCDDQVADQRGFTGAGLADDINMASAIVVRNIDRLGSRRGTRCRRAAIRFAARLSGGAASFDFSHLMRGVSVEEIGKW